MPAMSDSHPRARQGLTKVPVIGLRLVHRACTGEFLDISPHIPHHTGFNTNPIDLILACELNYAARRPKLTLTSDMVMAAVMTPGHFDVSAMSAAPNWLFFPPPHARQSRSCRIGCIG